MLLIHIGAKSRQVIHLLMIWIMEVRILIQVQLVLLRRIVMLADLGYLINQKELMRLMFIL